MNLDWDTHVKVKSSQCARTQQNLWTRGVGIDVIIIHFSKDFNLIPHDRLLTKLAALGVVSRVIFLDREFFLGRTQRVRVGGQLSKEVKVTSGVPQGSVLGPLLVLVYVNDIWRYIDSSIRLFADNCIIYRKIKNTNDIEYLQNDLNTLGEWAVENWIKMNPGKSKAIRFTRSQVKNPLGYSFGDKKISEMLGNHLTK